MARRRKGRSVNGILLLNKPLQISSNAALQKVKWLFFAAKAGHTGSLDPLATGVLPVCLGEATKFTRFLLDADKCYRSTFRFGMATASGDADGEVLGQVSAAGLTQEQVVSAMGCFRGEIEQVPPMYSALKYQGQPLYKLAREGIEIEREPRPVVIRRFELLDFRPGESAEADVEIHCSKGTYVRTLAQDLGAALGCGAYVSKLHRTAVGPFDESDAIALDGLEAVREAGTAESLDRFLKPMDAGISHLPAVYLLESVAWYFQQGQPVSVPGVYDLGEEGCIVRVFAESGALLGVAEIMDDGRIAPKRLVVY
ncbi:MAG: tRNA pseudouridine(55) synthase TruB [Porticoccaceae bacterium]|nr:tRNA pseudouridine(55) synthase TruB [Pseudomonadales bacterium]MCP5170928.1 tRNA pseudouridine(55) synthase TruB [Pseudomonadales bacterium]MCP5301832.1 tRNA pseudouridine(55) synthase TruB [Pseudomonadales bacterium]